MTGVDGAGTAPDAGTASEEISLDIAGDFPRLKIAMIAYPDLTVLDLVGPQAVFSTTSDTYIVARTLDPILGESGLSILPTTTYDEVPDDLDVLFVPGGRGALEAMEDPELLQFLRDKAETAKWVTAVCSGSLVLGAAGLLNGYRATTHWASHEALALFEGVTPVQERVVVDGNRFSGGGVTAGIDFGLTLLAALRGAEIAQLNQLLMEYDPQPPYNAGSAKTAPPEITALARQLFGTYNAAVEAAARRSAGASIAA
ncbi:DJ-1/PfpI family protein [uncultured Microbacterium sp.]|uniref:DJ-1/PfpI family protein n=1 Tax=uncultured Microbacterium sp. TaxID=191216 RepID=UPI0035CBE83E